MQTEIHKLSEGAVTLNIPTLLKVARIATYLCQIEVERRLRDCQDLPSRGKRSEVSITRDISYAANYMAEITEKMVICAHSAHALAETATREEILIERGSLQPSHTE